MLTNEEKNRSLGADGDRSPFGLGGVVYCRPPHFCRLLCLYRCKREFLLCQHHRADLLRGDLSHVGLFFADRHGHLPADRLSLGLFYVQNFAESSDDADAPADASHVGQPFDTHLFSDGAFG